MSREVRPDQQVVITRTLRHPPARVFAAWTSAEHLQRWLTPGRDTRLNAQIDCREGGELALTFFDPDGTVNRVAGRYLLVRPPAKLVFTWTWLSSETLANSPPRPLPLDAVGVETLVVVECAPHVNGTLLTITHQRFKSDAEAERHGAGWNGALDQLLTFLETYKGENE